MYYYKLYIWPFMVLSAISSKSSDINVDLLFEKHTGDILSVIYLPIFLFCRI